jgi:hypothetical protein
VIGMFIDRVYPDRKFVVTHFSGELDAAEILEWIDQLTTHRDFAPDFDGVIDFRQARFTFTPEDLQRFVERIGLHQVSGRWAHLVVRPLETAISMLYQPLALSVHPVAYFSTIRGASGYLGRDLLEYLPDDGLN